MTKKITIAFFLLIFLTSSSFSNAGFAGGPYFLWINFSKNTHIDDVIASNRSQREDCGEPDMKIVPAPEWISRDLIDKAVIHDNKNSISTLDKLLRKKYPEYSSQGLDGIIVYTESPTPHFLNFVRGRKIIIKERLKKGSNDEIIWQAFCLMVPPITRPI
ncbi:MULTISPECIES: hypothetical protein [unclassified Duganella]|uniref:hypothetical protein n=1 Tax=unclassified Duganella TaxID=2636909 RepID=UPI0012E3D120|nr:MULTISPECIES: hypothetical protein [unclassified Duganella]